MGMYVCRHSNKIHLINYLQLNITEFTNFRPKMVTFSLKTFRLSFNNMKNILLVIFDTDTTLTNYILLLLLLFLWFGILHHILVKSQLRNDRVAGPYVITNQCASSHYHLIRPRLAINKCL